MRAPDIGVVAGPPEVGPLIAVRDLTAWLTWLVASRDLDLVYGRAAITSVITTLEDAFLTREAQTNG